MSAFCEGTEYIALRVANVSRAISCGGEAQPSWRLAQPLQMQILPGQALPLRAERL